MEIKKEIKTKYGICTAKFLNNGAFWEISVDGVNNTGQADTLEGCEIAAILLFEMHHELLRIKNNSDKNKVDKEILDETKDYRFKNMFLN